MKATLTFDAQFCGTVTKIITISEPLAAELSQLFLSNMPLAFDKNCSILIEEGE